MISSLFLSTAPQRLGRVVSRHVAAVLLSLAAPATITLRAAYQGPVPAPSDAFGGPGSYVVITETFPSPDWPGHVVTVLRPDGAVGPRPTWFFAHGFGGTDPALYGELLTHLASHGEVVVFSPYPTELLRVSDNYTTMYDGFTAAAARYPGVIDTTRVGFAGHSYGGGAVPAIALRAIRERGWGANGVALLMLAPWYTYFVSDADLAAFQPGTQAVVETYEDDTMNDHRMAIDIFNHLGVAAADKDFLRLRSDRIDGYNYTASHLVPTGANNPRNGSAFDALDAWGVLRIAQALGASAWTNDPAARAIALGHGAAEQVQMGVTAGGRALRPMVETSAPVPLYPSSRYVQRWDGALNPRPLSSVPTVAPVAHLSNVSARAVTSGPDDPLIVGANITGFRPKSLLVRAVGPTLATFQVPNACANPALQIYRGTVADIALDDWSQSPDADALAATTTATGAFPLPDASADAAVLASFAPGTLTVHGVPATGTAGSILVELYDAEIDASAVVNNLSVRARIAGGDNTLLAGFATSGPGNLRLLIRAVGPTLGTFGVNEALADPRLEIYHGQDVIATNDNWSADANLRATIEAAAASTGAFPLPDGSRDAAMIISVPAGAYSAVVHSQDGSAGTGLVEVYVLPSSAN